MPYGIKCFIPEINSVRKLAAIHYDCENTLFDFLDKSNTQYEYQLYKSEFKPYLIPESNMSFEQEEERHDICKYHLIGYEPKLIDFYNRNHIDYRGLIEKGLALDATGLNIY
jgi:hypothetical protein